MDWLWRKLLTRPVWLCERAWAKLNNSAPPLPPLATPTNATPLVIQTTVKTFANALWTATSLLHHLERSFSPVLVLDAPTWPQALAAQAHKLLPGAKLTTTYQLASELPESCPTLRRYAQAHPLGRKLATILAMNQKTRIVFADDDLLAFAKLEEILAWDKHPQQALILTEETTGTDPTLQQIAQMEGLMMPPHFNSGFIALPKETVSAQKAEALLRQAKVDELTWFAETTLLAYQLANAQPLPADTYVVNCRRQFFFERDIDYTRIKLRHFVGPVRHLLRLRGIPAFIKSCS